MRSRPHRRDDAAGSSDPRAGGPRGVVICNAFSDDNRGGAAITAATIDAAIAAFPGSPISLIAVSPDAADIPRSHRHTLARFPEVEILPAPIDASPGPFRGVRQLIRSLVALLGGVPAAPATQRVRDAAVVVSKGGHVFIDRGGLRGLLSLWITAWPLMLAHRHGVPTVVFCSTIGPYRSRSSRALNAFLLRRVSLVMPRDPRSYAEALDLGIDPGRVVEVPDSVFGTSPPSATAAGRVTRELGFEGLRFGVVTVRPLADETAERTMLERLRDVIMRLLDDGIIDRCAVVVHVNGRGGGDLRPSREFVALIGEPRATLVDADLSPEALIAFYAAARFVIGARMHSTIFAVVAGTPTVSVAIRGAKAAGVFESLGLPDLVVGHADIEPAHLAQRLAEMASSPDQRSAVREAARRARERTLRHPDLLRLAVGDVIGIRAAPAHRP